MRLNPSALVLAFILSLAAVGAAQASICDVNGDGTANVADVQGEVNQALGISTCKNDLNQDGQCDVLDVQLVVNAALGGPCGTNPPRSLRDAVRHYLTWSTKLKMERIQELSWARAGRSEIWPMRPPGGKPSN